jgi:hypothetical protein
MPNDNKPTGIARSFVGLPIEDLICSPLIGMAKGQAKLNDVTWKYISDVAFEDVEGSKGKKKTRALDVQLNRYVVDPESGKQVLQQIESKVPMLPLVPLPSLAITSADINFTMEVKQSAMHKNSVDTKLESEASVSGGFWGAKYSASISGSVATHAENTRSTDNSAKYDVKVHAEQLPATEGMLKLCDMLNMMIEPHVIQDKADATQVEKNSEGTEEDTDQ